MVPRYRLFVIPHCRPCVVLHRRPCVTPAVGMPSWEELVRSLVFYLLSHALTIAMDSLLMPWMQRLIAVNPSTSNRCSVSCLSCPSLDWDDTDAFPSFC